MRPGQARGLSLFYRVVGVRGIRLMQERGIRRADEVRVWKSGESGELRALPTLPRKERERTGPPKGKIIEGWARPPISR